MNKIILSLFNLAISITLIHYSSIFVINELPDPIQSEKSLVSYNVNTSCVNLSDFKKSCSEGVVRLEFNRVSAIYLPLLYKSSYILDKRDMDSLMTVTAVLTQDIFSLYTGNEQIKSWKLSSVKIPLETVDDICFSLRFYDDVPEVFCSPSKLYRNFWINSIHETFFCKKNYGVEGKLPVYARKERKSEEKKINKSGIVIHMDSTLFKNDDTKTYIAGHPINDIVKKARKKFVSLLNPKDDLIKVEDIDDEGDTNRDDDSPSVSHKPREHISFGTIMALKESRAEKQQISNEEAPPYGYLNVQQNHYKALEKLSKR